MPAPSADYELRDALFELKWTHKEAAEHLGIHPNTVYRYASGVLEVPGPVLAYIRLYRSVARSLGRK